MLISVLTKRELQRRYGRAPNEDGAAQCEVTADHPIIVGDGEDGEVLTTIRAGGCRRESDWLPLAGGADAGFALHSRIRLWGQSKTRSRRTRSSFAPRFGRSSRLRTRPVARAGRDPRSPAGTGAADGGHPRSGALRLPEASDAEMDLRGATLGTARSGNLCARAIGGRTRSFGGWSGSILAEGHVATDRGRDDAERRRIFVVLHPTKEEHLGPAGGRLLGKPGRAKCGCSPLRPLAARRFPRGFSPPGGLRSSASAKQL